MLLPYRAHEDPAPNGNCIDAAWRFQRLGRWHPPEAPILRLTSSAQKAPTPQLPIHRAGKDCITPAHCAESSDPAVATQGRRGERLLGRVGPEQHATILGTGQEAVVVKDCHRIHSVAVLVEDEVSILVHFPQSCGLVHAPCEWSALVVKIHARDTSGVAEESVNAPPRDQVPDLQRPIQGRGVGLRSVRLSCDGCDCPGVPRQLRHTGALRWRAVVP
mmetsp:Transcript_127142/g.283424  ORF Transcript_127142/g.283424 Transcript_127142/m.283424 type:complete len:218 (+) Transcript_127142:119-772(+)